MQGHSNQSAPYLTHPVALIDLHVDDYYFLKDRICRITKVVFSKFY